MGGLPAFSGKWKENLWSCRNLQRIGKKHHRKEIENWDLAKKKNRLTPGKCAMMGNRNMPKK